MSDAVLDIISKYRNAKISPSKVVAVANSIRGKSSDQALLDLAFQKKKAGAILEGVVKSAIANAENNYKIDKNSLYVYDVKIGPGMVMKRGRFAAKGRSKPILKRNTNITVVLRQKKPDLTEKSNIVNKEAKVE